MGFSAAHTRQATIELLEGTIGTTFKLSSGVFKHGTFDGQPTQATQAKAMQASTARHWFDVQVGSTQTHEASPISAQSNRRICKVPIRIDLTTHLLTTIQESERKAYLAFVEHEATQACTVLHCPNNLTTTDAGGATGILGGLLRGASGAPSWVKDSEDWKAHLMRSHIDAEAIVEVVQAEDPDTIYGSDLEAWYRSDDGTFSQAVVSQVDDKTANANHLTASGSTPYVNPGLQLNYTPDITLLGVDEYMQKGSGFTLGASDCTVWLLAKVDTWGNGTRLWSMWGGVDGTDDFFLLRTLTGSDRWSAYISNLPDVVEVTSTTSVNDGEYHLIRVHVDSATANTIGLGIDGATPATTAWTGTNATIGKFVIGTGFTASIFADMTFKECIVVGAVSTSAQDAKVLDYIRARYGLDV